VDALGDMARDIALIELNPQDWVWWGNYLLKSLQTEAQKDHQYRLLNVYQ
jgi:hypothetical protein